ncbi:MAG: site-specific DNA-methyltransferase [Chthoniobacteraceae bacterium]
MSRQKAARCRRRNASRPIKDLDALDKVPGIGSKTIEALRELLIFSRTQEDARRFVRVPLRRAAMPALDFKGKSFIYTHHLGVPYRELLVVPEKSEPAGGTPDLDGNLILHGDNLEALKALLPRYAGKVDCIYIDPPYNTGGDWGYSDDVNSPLMREWLKRSANPVDREDLLRHDKWLCMMWPRLQVLRELLSEDGAIFVSIGNHEEHRLRCLMDEIFGDEQFVACFVWKSRAKPSNIGDKKRKPQQVSEYVLVYAKAGKGEDKIFGLLHSGDDRSYPHKHGDRKYRLQTILKSNRGTNQRDTMTFEVEGYTPPAGQRWQGGETEIKRLHAEGYVEYREGTPFRRYFEDEEDPEHAPIYTFIDPDVSGTAEQGKNLLNQIVGDRHNFDSVKPLGLVEYLLRFATERDSIILDSFGGSGTTAHAVLALNAKDEGNRKFILVQCDEFQKETRELVDICDTLTAERVRRVIRGYDYTGTQETDLHPPEKVTWTTFAKDKNRIEILERIEATKTLDGANYEKIETKIEDGVLTVVGKKTVEKEMPGLGGSFTYVELGEAMDLERLLAETPGTLPGFPALARYLFHNSTGHTLATTADVLAPGDAPVLIGETAVWRIYLHYRPDEAWLRSPAAAFTRTQAETIAEANKGSGKQVLVFAAAKFIAHRALREVGVDFAQLPYALHRVQAE